MTLGTVRHIRDPWHRVSEEIWGMRENVRHHLQLGEYWNGGEEYDFFRNTGDRHTDGCWGSVEGWTLSPGHSV